MRVFCNCKKETTYDKLRKFILSKLLEVLW
jgi:hypothetical protein